LKNSIFLGLSFIFLLSACSTKEVFKPALLSDDWSKYKKNEQNIVDTSFNVALLEDNSVLTVDGLSDVVIQDAYRVISDSDGWIVSASVDGNLTLSSKSDKTQTENFELKKTIASASVSGDSLAVLFADNELALYSIKTKEPFFKDQGSESIAVDTRIVNPFFMRDLVVFSTLDGKVVIVHVKLKKKLRTTIVSTEENFNNIIYFNMIGNKIIAATGYKILSLSDKEIRVKHEIRNILYDNENIFITTKQGLVLSLTPDLELNAKVKFPFAHFLAMVEDEDKLYILEKEGYMIVLNKDMKNYTVHEADIEDGYVFVAGKIFYIADEQILIK